MDNISNLEISAKPFLLQGSVWFQSCHGILEYTCALQGVSCELSLLFLTMCMHDPYPDVCF